MDHLNVTLNFVISVNHNSAPPPPKKKLVMMNQGNYITLKVLVVSTYISSSCFFFSGFV